MLRSVLRAILADRAGFGKKTLQLGPAAAALASSGAQL
jgi:hypothetical protein